MTRPLASVARRGAIAILVVTAICQRADADSASPWHLQASLGYHFSSGEYGEERSTEIGYVPFIASVDHGPWNAELTLPYIRVSGPRGIVGTLGDPASTTTDVRTNSGLGDVQAVFRFTATPERAWLPTTTAALRIKAPATKTMGSVPANGTCPRRSTPPGSSAASPPFWDWPTNSSVIPENEWKTMDR